MSWFDSIDAGSGDSDQPIECVSKAKAQHMPMPQHAGEAAPTTS
jgi:hypothetical protein